MKTFSVRFYKRLILLVLALMIIVPTVCAISLKMKCSKLEQQLASGVPVNPEQSARPTTAPVPADGEAIDYQELYPDLTAASKVTGEWKQESNAVYLTFDTSLNDNTMQILNILDQYGAKATFFVTGATDAESQRIMKEIVGRGHTIGLSSYSGSYTEIYRSVASYLEDFKKVYDLVYDVTGVRAEVFRFPGGSVNAYNSGIYQELIAEMLRRGFVFYDWNVSGEDTYTGELTSVRVTNSVLSGMEGKGRGIVLLHDAAGKETVVEALPGIILDLQGKGYGFQPLTVNVRPVIFSY